MMLTAGGFDSVDPACKLIQLHWQLDAGGPGLPWRADTHAGNYHP